MNVTILTIDNFEKEVSKLDGVIICENGESDTAHTCYVLLKIKEISNVYSWVFSFNQQKNMRMVYLRFGALGVITEDYEAEELQVTISNNLEKNKTKLNIGTSVGTEKFQLIHRNHSMKINGRKEIFLTRLEYKIMDILYENRNNTVIYKVLFKAIWGEELLAQKYKVRVANLIFHLREK